MPIERVDSIRDLKPAEKQKTKSSYAKRIIERVFTRINDGRLIVNIADQTLEFGQSSAEASLHAHIDIHDEKTFAHIIHGGITGAAEAYMLEMWSSPDLVKVIRLMVRNMTMLDQLDESSLIQKLFHKVFSLVHINDLNGSRKNISAHYDLGNDFFKLFLDETLMYSSAIYPEAGTSLEVAAVHKLDHICRELDLNSADHVIEIGTGWGGFSCYAAQTYGCKVTTTTISKEQFDEANKRVKALGLEDQVTVLFEDYRDLEGQYDKLVSIEMIEAVGHEYYQSYFEKCSSLLKPDGKMLIQAILMNDQRYDEARNSVDFIKRYIFPGGCLPSHHEIARNVKDYTDMQLVNVDDITYDYAKTLADWRHRFLAKTPEVYQQGYSESFVKMWDFYLAYCQGGFMERVIHTAQISFAKPLWRDPRYPQ